MCRILFDELIVCRIHRLISHIVCLLVIAVNAVINTAQNIKGSRDSCGCGQTQRDTEFSRNGTGNAISINPS
ncbi:hypothetical protein DVB85_20535 [Klebsiella oxytoca]|nr:hypothetical protein DVB85_20535 [Klebsiella oxytoca]TYG24385.1 hypothetical protein DJ549_19715 [Klebsiella grimontii]